MEISEVGTILAISSVCVAIYAFFQNRDKTVSEILSIVKEIKDEELGKTQKFNSNELKLLEEQVKEMSSIMKEIASELDKLRYQHDHADQFGFGTLKTNKVLDAQIETLRKLLSSIERLNTTIDILGGIRRGE